MILIADSGSTKTEWRLLRGGDVVSQLKCQGLNPYFLDADAIAATILEELAGRLPAVREIRSIFFYGAGCAATEKKQVVLDALVKCFPHAHHVVESDLLGAARGLSGTQPGMIAILGTGSNSGMYDGEKITRQVPSLGYVLGDEGSGVDIGRRLLKSILYSEAPGKLMDTFSAFSGMEITEILDRIYRQPAPNRFIASFSKFAFIHRNDAFVAALISESFREFLNRIIKKYPDYDSLQLHVTGSVGYYYSGILRSTAAQEGISVGNITEGPVAGIALYHMQHPLS
ncbi:MAG: N-acetylglucosamine kinase [Bacteroidia bacterium]|nr:N-acetylglucosamine kinase [Bacteroidia bacterium]